MRIHKDKLIQALKIMDFTPNQAIDIINKNSKRRFLIFFCHTKEWTVKNKGTIVFPGEYTGGINGKIKGTVIPQCIILTDKEKLKINSTANSASTVSLLLYHDEVKRNQLIKVLEEL